MKIYGIEQNTTRKLKDSFLQFFVQWFPEDKVKQENSEIELEPGCTVFNVRNNASDGSTIYLDIYGKDLSENLYYKSVGVSTSTSHVYFKTGSATQYKVQPNSPFCVQRIENAGHEYYILNIQGVYAFIDASNLLVDTENFADVSVYEFNTIFPVYSENRTTITYNNIPATSDIENPDNSKDATEEILEETLKEPSESDESLEDRETTTKYLSEIELNDSPDVIWSVSNNTILCSLPKPEILNNPEQTYVESINGIDMPTGTVSVTYNLASEVAVSKISDIPERNNINTIAIPGSNIDHIEAPCKLPKSFAGIGDNSTIFSTYGFIIGTPQWKLISQVTDRGLGTHYYPSCAEDWVAIPTEGVEDSAKGIADMRLKIDGNVPLLPVLPANSITELPEYRLFNPHFVSDMTLEIVNKAYKVKKVAQSETTTSYGYFKLTKIKGTSRKFAVCDGATVNSSGKSSGPSVVIVQKDGESISIDIDYTQESVSQGETRIAYLRAELAESASVYDCEVTLEFTRSLDDIDFEEPDVKYLIIGRAKRTSSNIKLYQDHTGIAYFDFSRKGTGEAYEGTFAMMQTYDSDGVLSDVYVKPGVVRIINRQVSVAGMDVPLYPGVVYIHATMESGSASAVIEYDDRLPTDDDSNSYYLIGEIITDSDGGYKIIQDHHGGTPLFLFFSTECIETEEESE